MEATLVIAIGKKAIFTALMIAGPILLVSLVIGVLISIFQAATSISDSTLNFAPKVVAAGVVILFMMPYIINKTVGLLVYLVTNIPNFIG